MRFLKSLLLSMSCLFSTVVLAEETMGEKANVVKNDAKRAVKKAAHRVQEAVCADSDAECLAKKAKNRAVEATEAAVDKASEVKNQLD